MVFLRLVMRGTFNLLHCEARSHFFSASHHLRHMDIAAASQRHLIATFVEVCSFLTFPL